MDHLSRPNEHDVAGLDGDPRQLARRIEVGRHDRVTRLEHVAPEGAGNVEQDAAADHAW